MCDLGLQDPRPLCGQGTDSRRRTAVAVVPAQGQPCADEILSLQHRVPRASPGISTTGETPPQGITWHRMRHTESGGAIPAGKHVSGTEHGE